MRKHGLKVLGLALMAAVGLMAFSATSALAVNLELGDHFYGNAEAPPEFLVNTGTLSPTLLATQEIKATQIGSGRFAIPKKKVEIVCSSGEITASAANEYHDWIANEMKTGAHATATLKAAGCVTWEINETTHALIKELGSCIPNYDTTPNKIEAEILFLGKKHEGVAYIVAVAKVSSEATAKAAEGLTASFAKVKYDIEKCAAVQTANILGSASFKPPTTDSIKPKLKINTLTADTLIGTQLRFGPTQTAFIEAEYEAELPNNPNVPWGVM